MMLAIPFQFRLAVKVYDKDSFWHRAFRLAIPLATANPKGARILHPFGNCLPRGTFSDLLMERLVAHYPDVIRLPVTIDLWYTSVG